MVLDQVLAFPQVFAWVLELQSQEVIDDAALSVLISTVTAMPG
jgi:hypothetical protein